MKREKASARCGEGLFAGTMGWFLLALHDALSVALDASTRLVRSPGILRGFDADASEAHERLKEASSRHCCSTYA